MKKRVSTKQKPCCTAAVQSLQEIRAHENTLAESVLEGLRKRVEKLEADRDLAAAVVRAAERVVDVAAPLTVDRQADDLQLIAAAASGLDPLVSAVLRAAASTLRTLAGAVTTLEATGGTSMSDEHFDIIRGRG